MKASEQYFPVVLFIMLYKMVLTFESVDEILKCDHSSESLLNTRLLPKKNIREPFGLRARAIILGAPQKKGQVLTRDKF